MLVQLSIANFVLLEELTVELDTGFCVLTGQTGAGKSMLVDALGTVLGARTRPDFVRAGAREAEVSALFHVVDRGAHGRGGARVREKLVASGIPCGDAVADDACELVVRRVITREGRSRAFINGRMCAASQLAELAPLLCDIASQHESVSLTDPATHLEYLDAFGHLHGPRADLASKVESLASLLSDLDGAKTREKSRAEREDFLTFQLRELEELDPKIGEEDDLARERERLRHAERLGEVTRAAAERLYEADGALCDDLGRVAAELESASAFDAALEPFAKSLRAARAELEETARSLAHYAEGVERDPARLAEVEDRAFRLQKLLRKLGPTTAELAAHRAELARDLDELRGAAALCDSLAEAFRAALAEAAIVARGLSAKRKAAGEKLARAIARELSSLGMGGARVLVDVAAQPAHEGGLAVDGARLGASGIDRVELLIAPNRGEEPRPLRRIASGGELSRALLALKRVLAGANESDARALYVFDEVDAGVSGAIAEVIGRAMSDVARHHQVLCITHLPQIAALADAHYVVEKAEARGRTVSAVRRLTDDERVGEIARMIGGVKVGDAARRAARELLRTRTTPADSAAE